MSVAIEKLCQVVRNCSSLVGRTLVVGGMVIPFCVRSLATENPDVAEKVRPNVVLILADDMGSGDVQALNQKSKIPTPNLNRLAGQGMTFKDAHSPSAVCTPTRYGLLTGRYCWRTRLKRGVLGGYDKPLLSSERVTIAEMLKRGGFQTAAVGKWHLGMELPMRKQTLESERDAPGWHGDPGVDFAGRITNGPNDHGFDHYFGVSASLDMAPYVYVRDDRFTQIPTLQQKAVAFPHFIRSGPRAEDFIVDQVLDRLTEEATDFIERAAGDKPFFLYLPLTGPHKPTQPHERFRGKTGLNEYGDFVHQVDWTVGRVLEALQVAGVAENTIVIFTSDNGSYMHRTAPDLAEDHVSNPNVQGYYTKNHEANGPWRGTKADVWEAGHRVPCFVRWPQQVRAASTCSATVCLTDFYATLAEIVGCPVESGQAEDSVSLVPLLKGQATSRGIPVVHHSAGGMFAIRDGKWKMVAGNGSGGRQQPKGKPFAKPFQLFDLESDPGENQDVASEHPGVVRSMTDKLNALRGVDSGEN